MMNRIRFHTLEELENMGYDIISRRDARAVNAQLKKGIEMYALTDALIVESEAGTYMADLKWNGLVY